MKKRLIWIAPLAILGMVIFSWIGGEVVMLLWNWLARRCSDCRKLPSVKLSDCWLFAGFCSEALVLVVVALIAPILGGEWLSVGNK